MDELIKSMQHGRTKRQWVKLLWQKAYLWRRFRNQDVTTKRFLAKALRNRLAEMSKAEGFWPPKPMGRVEKLVKHNRRERLMIHSILTDMFNCFITPDYLGTQVCSNKPWRKQVGCFKPGCFKEDTDQ